MINEYIFREYDIRGIAGSDIDRETAFLIGKAFSSFLKKKNPLSCRVSVGRDVRLSSDSLAGGLIEGITSAGIDVLDIGVCPTPLQYFSMFRLNLDGGIMVTGSHNPPEYNGFKISVDKDTIHGRDIQELKEIIKEKDWIAPEKEGQVEQYDVVAAYKTYMLNEFYYLNDTRFKKIKIVVDAGNGTAGLVVPEILNGIGCKVFPIYCEPDGNFPNHHPDPTVVENIKDLIKETKRASADIGVGYDGDADRIGIINKDGEIIWGDQMIIVLCREILKQKSDVKIIGDVKCSQVMFDYIKRHGGTPIIWKTGHSLIKQKMREVGALIAGEFSGHIFIADRYFGYDDAVYTTLRLIEIMKHTGKDIKELLSDIPAMHCTPEIRIDCPDEIKKEIVKRIVAKFVGYKQNGNCPYNIKELNTVDGVRAVFEHGWGLIRASNTQPVAVMRVEAEDKASLDNYRILLEEEFKEAMKAE